MSNLASLSIAALAAVYNQVAASPVKKFSSKAVALPRVERALAEAGMVLVFDKDGGWEVANKPEPVAAPVKARASRAELPESAVVTVLVEKNPKRGASAERFALYSKVRTVGEYLDACETLQGNARYTYRADVRWDVERGFIKIS